ncbi:helix-turn-helix transcriptional regulator [Candidatus Uhrbacteria bacterium]|nr:helix-turn-helix transcriptional regulator [Candidatus Uhrbacteria bacterium]
MNRKKIAKAQTLKTGDFQEFLEEQLCNPEFKKWYDYYGKQLETSYKILQMRKQKNMSQTELAKRIGTKQANIARIEAGNQNLTLETLQKLATVFDRDLRVDFVKQ